MKQEHIGAKDFTCPNPFNKAYRGAPDFYRYNTRDITHKSNCGRGLIVRAGIQQFDYIILGRVVTQRAGMSEGQQILEELIAHILDDEPTDDFLTKRAKYIYNNSKQENDQ